MNTEVEEWVDIKGYEGLYQVSSEGRDKGLARRMKHPTKKGFVPVKECMIKLRPDKGRYLCVGLWRHSKVKTRRVHQLVAIAFLNHTPCGFDIIVDHKDFDRTNNRKDNLQLITTRKNTDQKHLPSTSEFVGVHISKGGKWLAKIWIEGSQKYLGTFVCEKAAAEAYQKALKAL